MMAADMARTSPRTSPRAYRSTPAIGTSQTFTRTPMTSPRAARIWEEAAKRPTAPAPPYCGQVCPGFIVRGTPDAFWGSERL